MAILEYNFGVTVLGDNTTFLGEYADQTALEAAHPTASAGDYATVLSTGTSWYWDNLTQSWVDSGTLTLTQEDRDALDALILYGETIAGKVPTFADLPDVAVSVGLKYVVETGTGVWGINRKPAGTYLSTGTIWTSKFNAVDVINLLTSTETQKALSANMGKQLQDTKLEGVAEGTGINVDNTDPLNPEVSLDPSGVVTSVFTRSGDVTAQSGDYNASQIDNDSSVTGATVDLALEQLDSDIGQLDTDKVNVSDIVDNTTSTDTDKPLSANQGKVLKDLIDGLTTADVLEDPSALYFTEARVESTPAVVANTAKETNATHTGDVTGDHALTIAQGVVDNDNLADMAENTIKGRVSSGTGSPEDLSAAQAKSILQTTFTETVTADPNTDITAAEAETLTDTSNADSLHNHSQIFTGTTIVRALANSVVAFIDGVVALTIKSDSDVTLHNYNQTSRNDVTVMDDKVLTVNDSGDVKLRRVLQYSKREQNLTGYVNQTTTLANYLQLNVTIPETGDYVIDWDYFWSYNSGTSDFIGRLLLDGTRLPLDVGQPVFPDHRQEPKDAAGTGVQLEDINNAGNLINTGTDQRHNFCASYLVKNMTAGAHTITLQFACSSAGNEAAIYTGNIECRRQA